MLSFLVCEGGQDPRLLAILTGRLAPLLQTATEIELLHIMSQMTAAPGVRGWELRAGAREHIERHTREGELLEHDLDLLEQLDVDLKVKVKVRHGVVVDEILDEARQGSFDLIVIGAHQVTGWQRLLSADHAHEIILRGELPLLVV